MDLKSFIKGLDVKIHKYYTRIIKKSFFFEVQLTDHCNLNCVGCSHFSPIADKHFLDVASYTNDCERFSKLAKKYVHKVHLIGGEPLLHKDIVEIIEITHKYFEKSVIKIITNGILLDQMGPEFWNSCKKNNVIISITHYPLNLNVKKICELALQYGAHVDGDYRMIFRKDVYDISGKQNKNESFKKCGKQLCHHLYEGKFYMCPIPAYIKYFNKYFSYDFEVLPDDYIDIYKIKNFKTLLRYLRKPIPFCRYCNIDACDNNIPWHISKKEISEWT